MKTLLFKLMACLLPVTSFSLLENFTRCMNLYGLETESKKPVCSWVHPPEYYISELKQRGFNSLRVPFSGQYVREANFQELDNIVALSQQYGMTVLLDYHRNFNDHQGYSPLEGRLTMQDFINVWFAVLYRYQGYDVVQGVGLYNEYQGGDVDFWTGILKKTIAKIEERYPSRFIYFAGCPNWGSDCSEISLEGEPYWDRIVIEVHKYSFNSPGLETNWDVTLGSFPEKTFIGEIGWKQEDAAEVQWAVKFIEYLKRRNIRASCAWTVAHSRDTNGWWNDDCQTFNEDKMVLLKKLWGDESVKQNKNDPMQYTIEQAIEAIVRLRGSKCGSDL